MYNNHVRLVKSRCLYETTIKVEPIERVYLRSSNSQLTFFLETIINVEVSVRIYLTNTPSQLALFVLDKS
jgi:hypothetical protein